MKWVPIGAIFSGLAVALGAFGSHALRERLTPHDLSIYQTGVLYQFIHSLALILFGIWSAQRSNAPNLPGWAFTGGIVLFSFSLYLLTLTQTRWLGAITPVGGVLFLVGWAGFAWYSLRK